MHIFITGVCGFVGSSFALALRERMPGTTVSGIDNFIRPGSETNLARLRAAASGSTIVTFAAIAISRRCRNAIGSSMRRPIPRCWPALMAAPAAGNWSSTICKERSTFWNMPAVAGRGWFCSRQAASIAFPRADEGPASGRRSGVRVRHRRRPPRPVARRLASPRIFHRRADLALRRYEARLRGAGTRVRPDLNLPVVVNRCGVLAGEGQFGVAEQGIFSFWIRAYALRRPLKYIGFDGTGHQATRCLASRTI